MVLKMALQLAAQCLGSCADFVVPATLLPGRLRALSPDGARVLHVAGKQQSGALSDLPLVKMIEMDSSWLP